MLIALMCVPFALTSCEEEVVSGPNVYKMGITQVGFSANDLSFLSEMKTIEETYMNALGISSKNFQMEGKTDDCDNKIIEACKKAEEKLKEMKFKGSYDLYVTRISVNNETEIYSYKIEGIKPTTVSFGYTNVETEDMLEYCNIVLEYSDGKDTTSYIVTDTTWSITFEKQQLPCTHIFKKYYTLKEDKDMASIDSVSYSRNGYHYVSFVHDEKGEIVYIYENKSLDSIKEKGSLVAEKIPTGFFNTVNHFTFSRTGTLTTIIK